MEAIIDFPWASGSLFGLGKLPGHQEWLAQYITPLSSVWIQCTLCDKSSWIKPFRNSAPFSFIHTVWVWTEHAACQPVQQWVSVVWWTRTCVAGAVGRSECFLPMAVIGNGNRQTTRGISDVAWLQQNISCIQGSLQVTSEPFSFFSGTRRTRSDKSEWVSDLIDFNDVTLVNEDTNQRLYPWDSDGSDDVPDDPGEWWPWWPWWQRWQQWQWWQQWRWYNLLSYEIFQQLSLGWLALEESSGGCTSHGYTSSGLFINDIIIFGGYPAPDKAHFATKQRKLGSWP